MAVKLKLRVEENCDSLYIFDVTGKYNKKCNTGGWGNPNEKLCNVKSAKIVIYPPKQEAGIEIDVFPYLPNNDECGYEVLPADLGMENFQSGIWRFDFRITYGNDNTLIFSSRTNFLKYNLECCLAKKMVDADLSNYESEEVSKINNLYLLLESAEANHCKGSDIKAQEIIDTLNAKCNCKC